MSGSMRNTSVPRPALTHTESNATSSCQGLMVNGTLSEAPAARLGIRPRARRTGQEEDSVELREIVEVVVEGAERRLDVAGARRCFGESKVVVDLFGEFGDTSRVDRRAGTEPNGVEGHRRADADLALGGEELDDTRRGAVGLWNGEGGSEVLTHGGDVVAPVRSHTTGRCRLAARRRRGASRRVRDRHGEGDGGEDEGGAGPPPGLELHVTSSF